MRIFYSEHNKDYSSYTFDYAVYALMESPQDLPDIYSNGFLPYSNNLKEERDIFYLSRSLRLDLPKFQDSSENRRVHRKLQDHEISLELIPRSEFDFDEKHFRELCLNYAEQRFSGSNLSTQRFDYIISRKVLTHIIRFQDNKNRPIAYIFTSINSNMLHYWYAFFDVSYLKDYPLGKWLMWRVIKWAKEEGLQYVYLGTCYGKKALYKVRDFKALNFFDGESWNGDMKLLKSWCKADEEPLKSDRFKLR